VRSGGAKVRDEKNTTNFCSKSHGYSISSMVLAFMKLPYKKRAYAHSDAPLYIHRIDFAKQNRKEPTAAENKLWDKLRNRKQANLKFRRQHVIDIYIADFVCLEKRLIVEVDGPIHFDEEHQRMDEERSATLRSLGFRIIRFTNEMVLENINIVLDEIKNEALKMG
jgi:very-short-patch-repair endonuclease